MKRELAINQQGDSGKIAAMTYIKEARGDIANYYVVTNQLLRSSGATAP